MSSNLVPCPHCIAHVRKDKLTSHIEKVHRKDRAYATYKHTGNYSSARTPRPWSWDRGYYSDRSYDTYNIASDYSWSDTQYNSHPASPRSLGSTHSHRSSMTSFSEVSDFQSTGATANYLADSSDTESLSSNMSHTNKLGSDNSWIVFSSPTSVMRQRYSDGFKCPVPQCWKRFAEVEDVIQHAQYIHDLEQCPYCKGVNLKHSRTLADHIQEIHQKEPQNKKTNIKVYPSRPSSSGSNSSKHVFTTPVNPRKEVSNMDKLQASKDGAKSNSIKPLSQPVSDKIHTKTESKESIRKLPLNSISTSKIKEPIICNHIPISKKSVQSESPCKKELPSTVSTNKPKQETSKKLAQMINEKQQINIITCSPIPVTAVIKSKYPSRPNTPNTNSAINSSDMGKEDFKTLDTSVLITDNPDSPILNGEESNVEIICNANAQTEMSTDEINSIDSYRDSELEKDTNFQFINTGDLIGYSLNIR